jgi:DNA-binding NarL/FixJ family response regulator
VSLIRLILVDDHTLVREGIRSLLESLEGIEIVGDAADGTEALGLMARQKPDLALLDISMPGLNGLEATTRAAKEHPRTRVIMLSMHADDEFIHRAFQAGAAGYLLKNAGLHELELAVRAVARGEAWISPAVSNKVIATYGGAGKRAESSSGPLTSRQREILQLIAEGFSSKAIAERLDLSVKTVETHRTRLMDRLGIHGLAGLVRYAIRLGIVRAES